MSSKKKKSDGQNWYICDICKSVLFVKDTYLHKEKTCDVNIDNLLHPFIKNGFLHTFIEVCNAEDISSLQGIPVERQSNFILLSTEALKLLKIPIGDFVIVCPGIEDQFTPFAKKAWPMSGKNSLVAYVTKEVVLSNFVNLVKNVIIHPLKDVEVAKKISIKCVNEDHFHDSTLLLKLKHQYLDNIFCQNNTFVYSHYGKTLTFRILDIEGLNSSHSKNNDLKPLALSKSRLEFFIITDDTIWMMQDSNTENSRVISLCNDIGGLDKTIEELEEIISIAINNDKLMTGLYITRGILIFGPSGTGKTSLIEVMSHRFKANLIRIDSAQIYSKYLGSAERHLEFFFEQAKQSSPSFILIEELDVLCPKITERNDQAKRIVSTLAILLGKMNAVKNISILVFATTSRINDVHGSLRRPGLFGKEIEIHVPSARERRHILEIHLKQLKHNLTPADLNVIADSCHGFVGADLVSLVSKAHLYWYSRKNSDQVTIKDFSWALSRVKPSAMREVLIEIPNVQWSDIGGQEELKLKLRQAVEWPLKYQDSFKRFGIVPPKGLLMFGPPGCSKTMIAKALATESKLNFISVKGPELFSKWVGESEKAVREVFRRARQVAPSIVFFDELDAIGGERSNSSGGTNVEERVLAQLLTELDGVEPLGNVTVIGATNRLDRIDPALLRPGRFDRIVYVPLPDHQTRRQIFYIQFQKTPISTDVDLEELIEKTNGYSGAEIVAVCHEAALKALEEDFNSSFVSKKHFLLALEIITPRTPQYLIQMYEKYVHK